MSAAQLKRIALALAIAVFLWGLVEILGRRRVDPGVLLGGEVTELEGEQPAEHGALTFGATFGAPLSVSLSVTFGATFSTELFGDGCHGDFLDGRCVPPQFGTKPVELQLVRHEGDVAQELLHGRQAIRGLPGRDQGVSPDLEVLEQRFGAASVAQKP